MTRNIWEFLRKPDGTYAVSHNGKLLSDSIPEKWFESKRQRKATVDNPSESFCRN